jgi:putative DNA primase/helicase
MSASFGTVPAFLMQQPRWLLWRTVKRGGKATKAPLTAAGRFAKSTDPATWTTFQTVETVLRLPGVGTTFHGIGIALGDLGNSEHLCGIDFDGCVDAFGDPAPWAQPILAVLQSLTYSEISPSGGGLKFFFRTTAADAAAVRDAFGIEPGKWGCKRSVAGAGNSQEHGPAIEVYLGPGRYFTITAQRWALSPHDVALLDADTLQQVAALVRQVTTDAQAAEPDAGTAKVRAGNGARSARPFTGDRSRSGAAFRRGAALIRNGASFEEMCAQLRAHPETAEWCREKGDRNNGRELRRIWANAGAVHQPAATITVLAGRRHEAADAGLAALVGIGAEFYQRSNSLVRVAYLPVKGADGTTIPLPTVLPVTPPMLGRALGQAACWQRVRASGEVVATDPPKEVVEQIASMAGGWPFPPPKGVIETPTMRPDGSLLTTPGYDPATGYVLCNTPPMPAIPEHPSRDDALKALERLEGLLAEFPFADTTSLSVALSAMMTPVLRAAMAVAPMHVVTAPEAGTGKSYLLDVASMVATGHGCAVIAVSPNERETESRLVGAALSGHPIIALDNVSSLLMGDFLCQVTERPLLRLRPLGTSEKVIVTNSFTVFANGNNLVIGADAVRRIVQAMLDANLENPDDRIFKGDPIAAVRADRGAYVAAVLTIARAYVAAGRPKRLPPKPSYGAWSDLVRSSLAWLGKAAPCGSTATLRTSDPIRQARAAVFKAWANMLGTAAGYRTSELITGAMARSDASLREALLAIAAARSGSHPIDAIRLGRWLQRNVDTVAAGYKLTVDRSDAARPCWKLNPLSPARDPP